MWVDDIVLNWRHIYIRIHGGEGCRHTSLITTTKRSRRLFGTCKFTKIWNNIVTLWFAFKANTYTELHSKYNWFEVLSKAALLQLLLSSSVLGLLGFFMVTMTILAIMIYFQTRRKAKTKQVIPALSEVALYHSTSGLVKTVVSRVYLMCFIVTNYALIFIQIVNVQDTSVQEHSEVVGLCLLMSTAGQ